MKKILWYVLFFFIAVLLILLDQWTKSLAVQFLKGGKEISLIPHILVLVYVENPGAAFGILHGQQGFFLIITIAVLLGILYVLWKLPKEMRLKTGKEEIATNQLSSDISAREYKNKKEKRLLPLFFILCFIFSGAIGNFIDRQLQSYVVDFIYFKPIDFPVFNVADIYVTLSCIGLFLLAFFYYNEDDFAFLKH